MIPAIIFTNLIVGHSQFAFGILQRTFHPIPLNLHVCESFYRSRCDIGVTQAIFYLVIPLVSADYQDAPSCIFLQSVPYPDFGYVYGQLQLPFYRISDFDLFPLRFVEFSPVIFNCDSRVFGSEPRRCPSRSRSLFRNKYRRFQLEDRLIVMDIEQKGQFHIVDSITEFVSVSVQTVSADPAKTYPCLYISLNTF